MNDRRTRIPYTHSGPARIAVLGAHSTGKTTFARELADTLGLIYIPEQAREVAKDMGLTPATIPVERFCEFQRRALESHYAAEVLAENGFVACQSVFTYGVYFDNPPNDLLRTTSDYRATQVIYRNLIRLRASKYSFIVYIPKMFDLVQDGERHGELAFQDKIQADIETKVLPMIYRISTTAESELLVCKLSSDGPRARVAEVLTWIAAHPES